MKIQANGITINYRFDGHKDAPVVMLSNSLLSNYTMWNGQMDALATSYRVLRYDQRGHGGTETTPGPYTIELLADDAAALVEALGVDSVHFVGLSMGGFTGQMLAVRHPEKIASLTLCDTACVMPPESLWNERIEIASTEGIEALVAGTLERWFTPSFRDSGKVQVERVRAMILGTGNEGYIGCCKAIRDMVLCDMLSRIAVPTMIIVGEEDPACPVSAAQVLHDGIAGSELIVLSEAAHLPNIEKPAAFNDALLDFLDRQQG
jgi:3-oxoadipate enol-lactonase